MKKTILFFAAMLIAGVSLQAQIDSLPYNVNFPYYYMEHSFDSIHVCTHDGVQCQPTLRWMAGNSSRWGGIPYLQGKQIAIGFYPDSTIHIIGMAFVSWEAAVVQGSVFDKMLNYSQLYNSIYKCRIYAPQSNRLQLLDSAVVTVDDLDSLSYRLYQYSMDYDGNIGLWHPYTGVNNPVAQHFIVEAWFNQEIDVSDSVYMSLDWSLDTYKGNWLTAWYEYHNPSSAAGFIYPPLNYRVADTSANDDDPWMQGVTHCYPLVFPIIRRDCDTCPQVRNVELFKGSSTQFFLRWQRGNNHRNWQVSYGPAGIAPEDGTMLIFNQPQSSLITVDPDSDYVAYVRARCRFARDEWGAWSDPVSIRLNANAIDPMIPTTDFTLTPNPASGTVTIIGIDGESSIEIIDMSGRIITELSTQNTAHSIDISNLPVGSYVVRLTTAHGTTAHRLQVK